MGGETGEADGLCERLAQLVWYHANDTPGCFLAASLRNLCLYHILDLTVLGENYSPLGAAGNDILMLVGVALEP
jgi:hypothetical protein